MTDSPTSLYTAWLDVLPQAFRAMVPAPGMASAPAPGAAPSPGPMKVPAEKLRTMLGLSTVNVVQGNKPLAIVDRTLVG